MNARAEAVEAGHRAGIGRDEELLIVAVEASADLHGAAVLRELRTLRPGLRCFGAAGPLMRAEGCEALVRAEDLSVMGIAEVIPALPRIFRALGTLRRAAAARRPRAALLIDSPDFNLRLARKLRALGVKVVYFIGPSVWAWRRYRVKQIARDVARMLVILPFEAAFYAQHGVQATFVGNPLADEIAEPLEGQALKDSLGLDRARPVLALLPGSRRQEILRLWPPLLGASRLLLARRPDLQLVVPVAPTIDLATLPTGGLAITFVAGRAPDVLRAADAAIVASGTATLQAALAPVPLVVIYRLSWLSWFIARMLVRVKFVSLVNLLAGRLLVPELLQRGCTSEAIAAQAGALLENGAERRAQLEGLQELRREIAPPGAPHAARRAAQELLQVLESAP